MSTCSANAEALPSNRRGFLASIAAAGVLGLPALADAAGSAGNPDATLLALEDQLAAAVALSDELAERCDAAYEEYDVPELPETVCWQKRDFPSIWVDPHRLDGIGDRENGTERFTYASDGVLGKLRDRLAEWKAVPVADRFNFTDRCVARVEEIIAGLEVWYAEEAKSLSACGFTAASDAHDAQCKVVDELIHRIAALPARTAEGVCAKARAGVALSYGSTEWLERQLAQKLAAPLAVLPEDRRGLLALSAMIDAAKLGAAPASDRRAA